MNLSIKVIAGPDTGKSFQLAHGTSIVVGRGEQSDTRINDPSVSRVHFEIGYADGKVQLSDKGSSSGTFVNGEKIEVIEIEVGSIVQAGDSRLRIDIEDAADITIVGGESQLPLDIKPLPHLVGETLGPYQLTEVIGTSKTGMVFKAYDAEKDRIAAVKVLSPQYTANDEQRKRFVRAMKIMLQVKHDRIIRLYNAGKNGPYCWAGMELIEGINLAQQIERVGIEGMLDWKEVWRVALDVGLALQAGYEHQIIHRNVTPTNIMRRSSDGTCLLGDFILAKALEGTLAQEITQPGQILGSIAYMAPERTRADAQVDTRSDMYGLGATCYALLTGHPPTGGSSTVDMIKNVREQIPALPKTIQLSINEDFQDVVMKMIAKNPDDRFPTPSDMLKELARIAKYNNLEIVV